MIFKAIEIAGILNGKVEGDENVSVHKLAKIEQGEPGSISFLANPKYTQFLYSSNASIVIVDDDFIAEQPVKPTLIRVKNAYIAFAELLDYYNKNKLDKKGISKNAAIANSAKIGNNV